MQWSVYNEATKRAQYSTVPTSSITAEAVTVDGFALSQEKTVEITDYQANALNQYAMLSVDDITDFIPPYDAAGNQTRVKTSTGIWSISYDAENRPTDFTSQAVDGSITTVHCEYDYMGRRTTKMVTVGNNVTLQQRYIYRGYLQIACIDLTRSHHPALWYITWNPTQPVATRPLAIQKDGSWFTYGWDLTKNICELYGPSGYIRTAYTYAPYGQATSTGDVDQPIQWSSEYNDTELGLIYYNYRHYNPVDGRWMGRDCLGEAVSIHLYIYCCNCTLLYTDKKGNEYIKTSGAPEEKVHNGTEERGPEIVATANTMFLKKEEEPSNAAIITKRTRNPKTKKIEISYYVDYPQAAYKPIINLYLGNLAGVKSLDAHIPGSRYDTYRKHEMHHIKMSTFYWNSFVDESYLLQGPFCSSEEAMIAREVAQSLYEIKNREKYIANLQFDYIEYVNKDRKGQDVKYMYEINLLENEINKLKNSLKNNMRAVKYGFISPSL